MRFPDQDWLGLEEELELVEGCPTTIGRFTLGDRVTVGVDEPEFDWGEVEKGDIGVIAGVFEDKVFVDFPAQEHWMCRESELEAVKEEE